MEGRVRQLKSILDNTKIVEAGDDGTVGVGSVVTIVYDGDSDDMAERYLIGHPEEKHPELMVISPGSPLGKALLGADVGSTVSYHSPNGVQQVKVTAVGVR